MRGGEVLHEELLGLSRRRQPAALDRPAGRGRARGGRRRWLGAGRADRGRARARVLRRHPHRHRDRPRAERQHRPAGDAASARSTRSAGAGEWRARGEGLAVLDARRGEVFAALYYGPAASGSGSRWSPLRRSWRSGSPSCPRRRWRPARGRYDFVMSWRVGTSRFPTTPTPSTGSPRGTSAPSRRPRRTGTAAPSTRST